MARLPQPGGDNGKWGQILNDYLSQSHDGTGNLKAGSVGSDQIQSGSIQASHIASGSITKATVGLGNVDNTSDLSKPISTAAQNALDAKLASSDLDTQVVAKINDTTSATNHALLNTFAQKPNYTDTGYDIILLIGQSNMQGDSGGSVSSIIDITDPRVYTYNATGSNPSTISLASDPLGHQLSGGAIIGPGMSFARWYAGVSPGNRRVLLVPAAYNGTGLLTGTPKWDSSVRNSLYDNAVAQARAARTAAGANARIVAALWIQGESDAIAGISGAAYKTALKSLIETLRTDLASSTMAFVIGSMTPEFMANYSASTKAAINAAHASIPDEVSYTSFVQGPSGLGRGDNLHYSPAGAREMGRRMVGGLASALANVGTIADPTAPGQVIGLSAIPDLTQIVLNWSAPNSGGSTITNYVVEYRTTSGPGAWTPVTRSASATPSQTVSGLTSSTSYDFRVAAVNAIGTGVYSDPFTAVTDTPVAPPTAADDFNRTDSTSSLGTTSIGGLTWVAANGPTWGIAGNKAYVPSGSQNSLVAVDTGKVNGLAEVVFSTRDAGSCLVWRLVDSNNWYALLVSSALTQMCKCVGGSVSIFGSTSSSADGDVWKVEVSGSTFKAYRNGVLAITASDSSLSSGTRWGLRADTSGARFDDFKFYES